MSIQHAIDHLYRLAVEQGKAQSPARLRELATYCVEQLESRGLSGAVTETLIQGAGRAKSWDVAWEYDGKYRLGISLKSMLKNLAGTVPNRIDDLMGETANVQLESPEIVVGYIMVLDVQQDSHSPKHGATWSEILKSRMNTLSGRTSPTWTIGTVEAALMLSVDFSEGPTIVSGTDRTSRFFDTLVTEVRARNPNV